MPVLPLPTLLRLCLRAVDSPAVQVTPGLSAQRLEGARAYADYGTETPLLVLDDSPGGSGEEGVLVTSSALYFCKPRWRVPLAHITEAPTYPDGPRRPGMLACPEGAIALPLLKLGAPRDALHRVLTTIAMFNRGSSDPGLPSVPMSETALGELVRKHLVHREIVFPAELSALALRTIGLATEPLDALGGEQVFAFVDESTGRATEGVLVTDRRLLYRRQTERLTVPYAPLQQAWVEGSALGTKLEILSDGQRTSLTLDRRKKALQPLAAFLDEMAQTIPPEQRLAPIELVRLPDDPAGLGSAAALLGQEEPQSTALCALLTSALKVQALPADAAWDFANRTLLLHHGLRFGRSMHEGWWVSPLPAADLLFALRSLLGIPYREGAVGEGHALDLALDARRAAEWAKSIASGPIGQALSAVFGAGCVRTPPPPITALRVEVHPLGPNGLFGLTTMLKGRPSALDEVAGPAFAGLDRQLAELEGRLLFRRVLLGWGSPAQEMLQTPISTLLGRVEQMGGEPRILQEFESG